MGADRPLPDAPPSSSRMEWCQLAASLKALAAMPDETVIEGGIVALDEAGEPTFNALLNYGSSQPKGRWPVLVDRPKISENFWRILAL
jgi:hypothetical protein